MAGSRSRSPHDLYQPFTRRLGLQRMPILSAARACARCVCISGMAAAGTMMSRFVTERGFNESDRAAVVALLREYWASLGVLGVLSGFRRGGRGPAGRLCAARRADAVPARHVGQCAGRMRRAASGGRRSRHVRNEAPLSAARCARQRPRPASRRGGDGRGTAPGIPAHVPGHPAHARRGADALPVAWISPGRHGRLGPGRGAFRAGPRPP